MPGELNDLDQKVKKSDKGKWILVIVGIATLIITYRIYKVHSANASANAATSVAPGTIDPSTGMPYAQTLGPTQGTASTPDWSALSTNLNALVQSQAALTTAVTALTTPPPGSNSGPTYTDLSTEQQVGSGFNPPTSSPTGPIITPNGIFEWIASGLQSQGIMNTGGTIDIQPVPGQFVAVPNNNLGVLAPGTAQFVQVSNPPTGIPPAGTTPKTPTATPLTHLAATG